VAALDERSGGEEKVLAPWDENRRYNYHVSGDGGSYAFAREHYRGMVSDKHPPPDRADWVVVNRDRTLDGFEEDWHVGEAARVWQRGSVSVFRVRTWGGKYG